MVGPSYMHSRRKRGGVSMLAKKRKTFKKVKGFYPVPSISARRTVSGMPALRTSKGISGALGGSTKVRSGGKRL